MSKKQIVVLQRGWVVAGDVKEEGDKIKIENACVLRRWGTTKGLGELAQKGKQPNTVLDPAGTCEAHVGAVVLRIDIAEGVSLAATA